jgi:ankyrin repeat protein
MGPELRDKALIHELCHLYTIDFSIENGKRICDNGGFQTGFDEIITEKTAIKVEEFLGYSIETQKFDIGADRDSRVLSANLESRGTGYGGIINFGDTLISMYGEEAVFREKYLKDGSVLGIQVNGISIKEIDEKITDMATVLTSLEERMEAQNLLTDALAKKWEDSGISMSEYIESVRGISNSGITANMESGIQLHEFSTISSRLQNFEIAQFYSIVAGRDIDIYQEINPLTRSEDCKNFLVVMEGLKNSNISFSTEDLENMEYRRISSGISSKIILEIGGEKYQMDYKYDERFGMASKTEFEELSFFSKASNFLKIESTKEGKGVSFTDIIEGNQYTGGLDKIKEIIEKDSSKIDAESYLLSACVSSEISLKNEKYLSYILENIDLKDVKDSYGNNLLHAIANNPSPSTNLVLDKMMEHQPEAVIKLATKWNDDVITPLEESILNKNANIVRLLVENGEIKDVMRLLDAEKDCFVIGKEKVPVGDILFKLGDEDLMLKMVKAGVDADCKNSNGNNIISAYAKGEISGERLVDFINAGANVNCDSGFGMDNPVNITIRNGDVERLSTLLKFGGNPNCLKELLDSKYMDVKDSETTSVDIEKGMQMFKLLVDAGADPNYRGKYDRDTLLQRFGGIIDEEPDYKMIKLLVDAGANPFDSGTGGHPSLRDFAAEKGDVEIFKIMAAAGIDKESMDLENANLTAIERAMILRVEVEHQAISENDNDKVEDIVQDKSNDVDISTGDFGFEVD